MSLVVVLGATGAQGGSVVKQLSKDGRWKIRGVTRNVGSEKAISLARKVGICFATETSL